MAKSIRIEDNKGASGENSDLTPHSAEEMNALKENTYGLPKSSGVTIQPVVGEIHETSSQSAAVHQQQLHFESSLIGKRNTAPSQTQTNKLTPLVLPPNPVTQKEVSFSKFFFHYF